MLLAMPLAAEANSFAIVIDSKTLNHTRDAVVAYSNAVEHDGLKTYIIAADWQTPHQVRDSLSALYQRDPMLEGCVFVGDIPVAMIRNAQHMTTAFKMNEAAFGINESSVPSDRFYDCLTLKFKYLSRDAKNPQLHYYKLTEDSPQTLSPTFYSARIKYPEAMGGDKYKAIADFLRKAAKAKYEGENPLDQVFTYNGASYNLDCLVVYMDEEKAYREHFPFAFTSGTSFKHWNFRMNPTMRYPLLSELQRPDIDVFMFHEHGMPDQQLINDPLPGTDVTSRLTAVRDEIYSHTRKRARKGENLDTLQQMFSKKFGLLPSFWADYDNADRHRLDSISHAEQYISLPDLNGVTTRPRFVMFDACYNGSFHESDQIAGRYIFNPGTTLVVQGNTRNVLQDRWTIEMIGLLSHGVRVGQYNRQVATLEGHLIGDPTVHFTPSSANSVSDDIVARAADAKYWRQLLKSDYADLQSLALRMLTDIAFRQKPSAKQAHSSLLLDIFRTSRFNTVRMEALKQLSRYANADFTEAVRAGLNDPYERVARSCADYAGKIGDPTLIPDVIRVLFEDEDRVRIQYALNSTLFLFPEKDIVEAINDYFVTANRIDKEEELKVSVNSIIQTFKSRDKADALIADAKAKDAKRLQSIRFLRNNPRTPNLDLYLAFLADNTAPAGLRTVMAEALGWFNLSWRKNDIVAECEKLLETSQPEELKEELLQTINRIRQ